jgi:hypothetical protein
MLTVGKSGEGTIIKRYKGMTDNLNLWLSVVDEEVPDNAVMVEAVPQEQKKNVRAGETTKTRQNDQLTG